MKKYRKTFTPDEEHFEAIQFLPPDGFWEIDDDHFVEILRFVKNQASLCKLNAMIQDKSLSKGDWICRTKDGIIFVYHDKEFRETYEECE